MNGDQQAIAKRFMVYAALFGGLLVISLWLGSGYRIDWLFRDWTNTEAVPFNVRGKVEIAARGRLLKSSSASLLCAPDGVHLMLQSRLPLPSFAREDMRPSTSYTSSTQITLDWVRVPRGTMIHSIETKSAMVAFDSVDTVVTAPLTNRDVDTLTDWFRRGAPQHMTFGVSDTGTRGLNGVVDAKTISAFVEHCDPTRSGKFHAHA